MNILLTIMMFTLCLSLIALGLICATIHKDIKQNIDILAENQQKLSRQISSIKTNNIQLSTNDECIAISNTIAALKRVEEEKFVSYKQEISLLNKILYNGQH